MEKTLPSGSGAQITQPESRERRSSQLEVRAKGRKLEGYAALFGVEARIGDFVETIAAGAFKTSSREDVLALLDHDPARLLARTRSKTLRLTEDSKGLAFDLDVPDTSHGRDVLELAQRGDLGGMSFGFSVPADGEHWEGNKRELRSVTLHEISVVSAWPAYAGTVVNARAARAFGELGTSEAFWVEECVDEMLSNGMADNEGDARDMCLLLANRWRKSNVAATRFKRLRLAKLWMQLVK